MNLACRAAGGAATLNNSPLPAWVPMHISVYLACAYVQLQVNGTVATYLGVSTIPVKVVQC